MFEGINIYYITGLEMDFSLVFQEKADRENLLPFSKGAFG